MALSSNAQDGAAATTSIGKHELDGAPSKGLTALEPELQSDKVMLQLGEMKRYKDRQKL